MRKGWLERCLEALETCAKMRGRTGELAGHLAVGEAGEDAALFELRRKGYRVVARRWSASGLKGDIDLIAWQGPMLCFIEVKTRSAHDETPAEVAVDDTKRRVMRKLARKYVWQLPLENRPPTRFDVMSVYLEPGKPAEFVHFEAAFGWSRWSERD